MRANWLSALANGRARRPCKECRTTENKLSTGSGWLFSVRWVQPEWKRIWPSGGKSGGNRQARNPSQTARARPCCVERRAQS